MLCVWGIGHTSISLSALGWAKISPIVFTVVMSRQHFICSWLGKNLPIVFTVAMYRQHFCCRPRGNFMPQTISARFSLVIICFVRKKEITTEGSWFVRI
jgi:hypothetical protein